MEIHGASGAQGAQPVYPRLAEFSVDASSSVHAGIPRDQVQISDLGQIHGAALEVVGGLPEIRHERVEALRAQISSGVYETPEKMDLALDRLLDELQGW